MEEHLEHDTKEFANLKDFCLKLPKVELHAHLNGSLSEATMNKLLARKQKSCPDNSVLMTEPKFCWSLSSSLTDCFRVFKLIHEITDSPEAVEIATTDVITDFYNDGVSHLELRTTPREVAGSMNRSIYVDSVLSAINKCKSTMPSMSVKLILSVDRGNPTYAAEETLKLAQEKFCGGGGDIVGIDLSGNPLEGDISTIIPILQCAKNSGLKLTFHMAETQNLPDEVSELLELKPDRIGHGTFLHPAKGGWKKDFAALQEMKIPLEICLTSNIICGTVASYAEHHFPLWLKENYPCVLCTDDKGVFNTTLSNEFYLAAKHYSLGAENLWDLSVDSINYCFIDEEQKKLLRNSFLKEKDKLFSQLKTV